MLTAMTEEDWTIVLRVFAASRSRRGDKGLNDRKFLEALHYFVVHNITWRALPEKFGHWNSVWKRFWRLSRSGTFEAFFDALAAMSETAHLVQMFDSTLEILQYCEILERHWARTFAELLVCDIWSGKSASLTRNGLRCTAISSNHQCSRCGTSIIETRLQEFGHGVLPVVELECPVCGPFGRV